MDHVHYFKDLFESIPEWRKIVLLLFSFRSDDDVLFACGFAKNDIKRHRLELKKLNNGQNKEYPDYIKNEEETTTEKFFNK